MRAFLSLTLAGVVSFAALLNASEGSVPGPAALAFAERKQGNYTGAENLLRTAIADRSTSAGERAVLMVELSDLLREEARLPEAVAVLNEIGPLKEFSAETKTGILVQRAELASDMRQWEESAALWKQVGDLAESGNSPRLEAMYCGGLGEMWLSADNIARAEPLLRRSLDLLEKDPGAPASQVATALSFMASVYIQENKLAMAEQALGEAVVRDERIFGPDHPQMALLLELEAMVESKRGEPQPAREKLEAARTIMAAHFGPDSLAVAGVDTMLGDVEQRDRHPAAAAAQYRTAFDLVRKAGASGTRFSSALIARYAALLKAMHQPAAAKAIFASQNQDR